MAEEPPVGAWGRGWGGAGAQPRLTPTPALHQGAPKKRSRQGTHAHRGEAHREDLAHAVREAEEVSHLLPVNGGAVQAQRPPQPEDPTKEVS